ncbi:MICOS complex subunit Mic60-like [Ctenocephalides felis]|uniref:MICOS complex subunit Mic60-like n=1 Tax=Ctenocephalides felis TaxID=7515 RepID=UPI000E6E5BB1|nr:MICOS complex subunit Mic60-like [Ctenocephalides felis]
MIRYLAQKNGLARVNRAVLVRLYLCNQQQYQQYKFTHTAYPPKPKKPNPAGGLLVTFGAITLVGGLTLVYAKRDPEFREWLARNVPVTDSIIRFMYQEDYTYQDSVLNALGSSKDFMLELFSSKKSDEEKRLEKDRCDIVDPNADEYRAPRPAFKPLLEKPTPPEKFTEIRNIEGDNVHLVDNIIQHTDGKAPSGRTDGPTKKTIAQLEDAIKNASEVAVPAYAKATCTLKDYMDQVDVIIESSIEMHNPQTWGVLRQRSEQKAKCIEAAEAAANEAIENLNKMRGALESDIDAPKAAIDQAHRNLDRVLFDIKQAKQAYLEEKEKCDLTERYWKKIEQARSYFLEEIETLFPGTNICERRFKLEGSTDLDLFLLHVMSHVIFYQKELAKMQTIMDSRMNQALALARTCNPEELKEVVIEKKLEEERRCKDLEYQKKALCLRADGERDLRRQMKLQAEAHADHIRDAVLLKEKEMERKAQRLLDERLAAEKEEYKLQLAAMVGRLRGVDSALKARAKADSSAQQAQALWGACQALLAAIKANTPCVPWDKQLRPLTPEINAIEQVTAGSDELIESVVNGIPKEAKRRGVYSEDALRERFLKVERVARRLALVPEGGARLPVYLLSYLQSAVLMSTHNPMPASELLDQRTDFSQMDTYEILARARYWLTNIFHL